MARPVQAPHESVRTQFNEFDPWDVAEKLNQVRWALAGLKTNDRPDTSQSAAHNRPPASNRPTVTKPLPTEAPFPAGVTVPRSGRTIEGVVWAMNKAAIVLVTCGFVLLAWSWLAGRPDLPAAGWATSMLGTLAWLAGWCTSLTCRPPLRSGGRFS